MTTEREDEFDAWLRNSEYYNLDAEILWNVWQAATAVQAEKVAELEKELARAVSFAKAYDKRMMAAIRAHINESEKNFLYRGKLERAGELVASLIDKVAILREAITAFFAHDDEDNPPPYCKVYEALEKTKC